MNTITLTTASHTFWLTKMFRCINKTFVLIGYKRAIGELYRLGYHEEARRANAEYEKLKAEN